MLIINLKHFLSFATVSKHRDRAAACIMVKLRRPSDFAQRKMLFNIYIRE